METPNHIKLGFFEKKPDETGFKPKKTNPIKTPGWALKTFFNRDFYKVGPF